MFHRVQLYLRLIWSTDLYRTKEFLRTDHGPTEHFPSLFVKLRLVFYVWVKKDPTITTSWDFLSRKLNKTSYKTKFLDLSIECVFSVLNLYFVPEFSLGTTLTYSQKRTGLNF